MRCRLAYAQFVMQNGSLRLAFVRNLNLQTQDNRSSVVRCRAAFGEGIALLERLGNLARLVAAYAQPALALLDEGDMAAAENILARVDGNAIKLTNAQFRFAQARVLLARNKKNSREQSVRGGASVGV